jgi:uncharacterized protein (DUF427 family)
LVVNVLREQRADGCTNLLASPLAGDASAFAQTGVGRGTGPVPPAVFDAAHHPPGECGIERISERSAIVLEVGSMRHRGHAATVEPQRIEPGPGQESVWDYPRPPAIEQSTSRLRVEFGGITIAESSRGFRVLETSQPPAYYFPPDDVAMEHLTATSHRTFCEWKGQAHYYTVVVGGREATDAVWSYSSPIDRFRAITGYLAFYAQRMDACYVDGEHVRANEGAFYGGWITSKIVGPFKGAEGTAGW